jgi:WD40 repeat protein
MWLLSSGLLRLRAPRDGGKRVAGQTRYDAFISYSHAQGRHVAEALQVELERFARPWYRARRLRVFRDDTNLAATPHLWQTIETALAAADWLVLMASPHASRSHWVQREVDWWRQHRAVERILIAQTAGEIAWSGDDFDWDHTDALPRALAGAFREAPLWVDLRPLVPVRSAAANGGGRERRVHLGDLVAEFAAPIHGVEKDSLIGEHLSQRRRTRRTVQSVVVALSALLVAATTAAVIAIRQRNEAIRQRNVAEARRVAARADALRERRPDVSLMLAVQALKIAPVTEAYDSLVATLAQTHYAGSLVGHRGQVNGVKVSPSGYLVATASDDETVAIWDISERLRHIRLSTLNGFDGPVADVDLDPSGTLLVAGGLAQTLLWDISDPARPQLLADLDGSSTAVRFSEHGRVLAAAGGLWDVSDPARPVRSATLPGAARDLDISADGRIMVVAGRPEPTSIWDISDIRRISLLANVPDLADAAAISPNGKLLVLGPRDGSARMWNIQDPARPVPAGALSAPTGTLVFAAAFSPDSASVATAEADGTAVWNLQDITRPVQTHRLHGHENVVYAVAFSTDGRSLVTGGPAGVAMLWSLTDKRTVPQLARIGPFEGAPEIVRFGPDRRTLITAGSRDPITIWDIANRQHPSALATIGTRRCSDVAVSPDGTLLINTVAEHPPQLWDITDRSRPVRLGTVGDDPARSAFSPDGRTLARFDLAGQIDLWDLTQRDRPHRIGALEPVGYQGWQATFSPDGRILLVVGVDAAVLWNVSDRSDPVRLSTIPHAGPTAAFRPDGRFLAIDGPDTVLSLWDVSQPSKPARASSIAGKGGRDMAFSPDGLIVATGSSNAVATLWNLSNPASPTPLAHVNGHQGSVYNLAIGNDGTIATGSYDRTVRLWSMPDVVRDLHDPVAVACALAGQDLSPQDRQRYLRAHPRWSISDRVDDHG